MKKRFKFSIIGLITLSSIHSVFAATEIDLNKKSFSILQNLITQNRTSLDGSLKQLTAHTDFNQTTHLRVQQIFSGYPIWGADAIIHVPKSNARTLTKLQDISHFSDVQMNGHIYQNLAQDLKNTPPSVFEKAQAQKAAAKILTYYQTKAASAPNIIHSTVDLMVYVDAEHQAHWSYLIKLFDKPNNGSAAKPSFIVDAISFNVYQEWNDLKTLDLVNGGGIGGNEGSIGRITFDGTQQNYPILSIQRDPQKKICYLSNPLTIVKDVSLKNKISEFKCDKPDASHNGVYWNTNNDEVNGGYSPNNDVLYGDTLVRKMYRDWLNVDMLSKNNKPMQVTMYVKDQTQGQNAYYDNGIMVFGNGDNESYPVAEPSVIAHEMSHGFTEQHSDLIYRSQSGGLNESFSDMADKAVEYFRYGKNNWQIDPELLKPNGRLLRWMDHPTNDCEGRKPGDFCSIEHTKDYYEGLDVHFSSGIFNKAFMLIAESKGWNTHKAFEVMTKANMDYWTSGTTFDEAACGVLHATKDYGYNANAVLNAMSAVGVHTTQC